MRIYEGLDEQPEVLSVAGAMTMSPYEVMGRLVRLWAWVDRIATRVATDSHDAVIPLPIRGTGEQSIDHRVGGAPGFAAALGQTGWLKIEDDKLLFPNWFRRNGSTANTRIDTATRQARQRVRNALHRDGVRDGVRDGYRDGVRDGVRDGYRDDTVTGCVTGTVTGTVTGCVTQHTASSSSIPLPLPSSHVSPLLAREGNSDEESPERRFAAAAAAAAARFEPGDCWLRDTAAGDAVKHALRQLGLSQSMLDKLPADLSIGQLQTLASRIVSEKPQKPARWAWKWITEYRGED